MIIEYVNLKSYEGMCKNQVVVFQNNEEWGGMYLGSDVGLIVLKNVKELVMQV